MQATAAAAAAGGSFLGGHAGLPHDVLIRILLSPNITQQDRLQHLAPVCKDMCSAVDAASTDITLNFTSNEFTGELPGEELANFWAWLARAGGSHITCLCLTHSYDYDGKGSTSDGLKQAPFPLVHEPVLPWESLPSLQSLQLLDVTLSPGDLTCLTRLTSLNINLCKPHHMQRLLPCIGCLTKLQQLELCIPAGVSTTPNTMSCLPCGDWQQLGSSLGQLRSLKLLGCGVTEEVLQQLTGLTALQHLSLAGSSITAEGLGQCLPNIAGLISLSLENCEQIFAKPQAEGDTGLAALDSSSNSSSSSWRCQYSSLMSLSGLRNLQQLTYSGSTNDHATPLLTLKGLTGLTVQGVCFDQAAEAEAFLDVLVKLVKLQALKFDCVSFPEKVQLGRLAAAPSLTCLDFEHCQLPDRLLTLYRLQEARQALPNYVWQTREELVVSYSFVCEDDEVEPGVTKRRVKRIK